MSVLCDKEIKTRCLQDGMITPFSDKLISKDSQGNKILSYGLSSYGYDARLAEGFRIFTNINSQIVDPKNFQEESFVTKNGSQCIIPPNSFLLGRTVEYFKVPRDCIVICLGKSTYARCGIVINVTPLEPEWEGYVTLELSNTTPLPAVVYANEGVCQFLFLKGSDICEISYLNRNGKYQKQEDITLPRV